MPLKVLLLVILGTIRRQKTESENIVRKPYGPSKLAALLFSTELNRRYGGGNTNGDIRRIRSIAVNPGSV